MKIILLRGQSISIRAESFFLAKPVLFTLSFLIAPGSGVHAQRLPQTVVPSHYQLFVDPSIGGQKFSGEETITVQVQQPTPEIILNSLGLKIDLAEASAAGSSQQ